MSFDANLDAKVIRGSGVVEEDPAENIRGSAVDGVIEEDPVEHPAHYRFAGPYEVIKVIQAWGLDFECGNAVKYIARAGRKDPAKTVEDLRKAIEYLRFEIEKLSS